MSLRRLLTAAVAVALVGGCSAQPSASPKAVIGGTEYSGFFPKAAFGAYPPSPPSRRPAFRWETDAPPVRLLQRYADPVGRLSVDIDWPRLAWVEAATEEEGGGATGPRRVVVGLSSGEKRAVYEAAAGRIVESVKLSYPWLALLERAEPDAFDWRILLLRLPSRKARLLASGKDNGAGKRQFVPSLAFDRGVLAWDERVKAGRGYTNRIRTFDCRRGQYRDAAKGNVHLPSVANGRIGWNEERTTARREGVAVSSSLCITTGMKRERGTGTPQAMFVSMSEDTVVWLDMRRRLLNQPAMADAYCLAGKDRLPLRLTRDGLCSQALAGDGIVAWQDVKGRVLVADLSKDTGYRLAGFGRREAMLWDVDGRLVAWELQPELDDARMERELVVQEIGE